MISSASEPEGPDGGTRHPAGEDPQTVTFMEIRDVCDFFFTFDRQEGSHRIYKTGVTERAIVNIQPRGKMAKPYQCRQVAAAVKAKLKGGQ